ncbi:hypothetical protein [Xylella fastidiosa]|uniref:anti-repressor n=1 Tax=Xylella phage Xfas53 TaxID=670252 RepID=UPI0001B60FDD|nr:hypothetical protein [Xylella fastidiosa]YP_003344910.1 anti-repressor [Xylella phage Xfas53]ACV41120.1 repeat-encoded protein [Xylella phage Xfas53]UIT49145.1 hypothetical protein LZ752_06020 [Xylella fastidiosa subsp. fastidiosa]
MSLTTAHRCGTVAGKECKNSGNSGTRTRQIAVFLRLHVLRREGGSHTTPARGKLPAVCFRFLTLPTFSGRRVRTSPEITSHETGDVL